MICRACGESEMIPVSVEQLSFDGNSDYYRIFVCPRCWTGRKGPL